MSLSGHRHSTCSISERMSGHRPTRPFFDVGERLSYVKYIVKVNCGRGITGGGPLEVHGVLVPKLGDMSVPYPTPSLQGVSVSYLEVQPVKT